MLKYLEHGLWLYFHNYNKASMIFQEPEHVQCVDFASHVCVSDNYISESWTLYHSNCRGMYFSLLSIIITSLVFCEVKIILIMVKFIISFTASGWSCDSDF